MTDKRFKLAYTDDWWAVRDGEITLWKEEVVDKLNELADENEQLRHDATILIQSNQDYRRENEQLKQRNDRQAKRLDNLYHLIEKEDWKTLKGIIQEFKECEEQLQNEWGTYGDVE